MDAKQAKEISKKAEASLTIRPFVPNIEAVAKNGGYSARFTLNQGEVEAFKLLGYAVSNNGEVSWK